MVLSTAAPQSQDSQGPPCGLLVRPRRLAAGAQAGWGRLRAACGPGSVYCSGLDAELAPPKPGDALADCRSWLGLVAGCGGRTRSEGVPAGLRAGDHWAQGRRRGTWSVKASWAEGRKENGSASPCAPAPADPAPASLRHTTQSYQSISFLRVSGAFQAAASARSPGPGTARPGAPTAGTRPPAPLMSKTALRGLVYGAVPQGRALGFSPLPSTRWGAYCPQLCPITLSRRPSRRPWLWSSSERLVFQVVPAWDRKGRKSSVQKDPTSPSSQNPQLGWVCSSWTLAVVVPGCPRSTERRSGQNRTKTARVAPFRDRGDFLL